MKIAHCTDCGEPLDDAHVEAFETFDVLLCELCFQERMIVAEEADDLRRANPLEPDYRRLG